MNEKSITLSGLNGSYPDKPPISKQEFDALDRVDRILYHVLYPRHFTIGGGDDRYLELMKLAYNILINYPNEQQARKRIQNLEPGGDMDLAKVITLIRDTKAFYGRIHPIDIDFERASMRQRLFRLADKAADAGDLETERKTLKTIMDLDALAARAKTDTDPVIPELPALTLSADDPIGDPAILEGDTDSDHDENTA